MLTAGKMTLDLSTELKSSIQSAPQRLRARFRAKRNPRSTRQGCSESNSASEPNQSLSLDHHVLGEMSFDQISYRWRRTGRVSHPG